LAACFQSRPETALSTYELVAISLPAETLVKYDVPSATRTISPFCDVTVISPFIDLSLRSAVLAVISKSLLPELMRISPSFAIVTPSVK
jgi:hypothetical protein